MVLRQEGAGEAIGVVSPKDKGKKDKYDKVRGLAASWIGAADSKATALLALSGAVLTLFAIELTAILDKKLVHGPVAFFALTYCVLSIVSLGAAGGALWPRVDRKKILSKKGAKPLSRSPTFFGDLGSLSAEDFVSVVLNSEHEEQDALEQALVMTWIAQEKMVWIGISVRALVVALVALGLCVLCVAYGG